MTGRRLGPWALGLLLAAAGGAVAWLSLDDGPGRRPELPEGPARAPGLEGRGQPTVAVEDPANDEPEDLAEAEATWTGVVRDDRGRPVGGADVVLGAIRGSRAPLGRAVTDAEGRFAIRARRGQGRSALYAGGAGHLPGRVEVRRRGEEGIDVRVEPDRARTAVAFRVLDAAGEPLGGVKGLAVTAAEDVALGTGWPRDLAVALDFDRVVGAPAWDRAEFTTDGEGRVLLPSRLPGTLRVRALRGGDFLEETLRVPPRPEDGEPSLRLRPARWVAGTASVRRDPDWSCGHPDHRFEVTAPEEDGGPWPPLGPAGADGTFRVAVPPRLREVVVRTAGHPPVTVRLPSGEGPADVGRIEVPDARVVAGRLRFADGTPVRHAVLVYGVDPERRVETDAGGLFRLEAAERPSRRDPARVEVPGLAEPVPLVVDLAAVPLEVVLPAGVEPPRRRPEEDE